MTRTTAAVLILALLPLSARAEAFFVPSYWNQSNFLSLTPSVSGDAAGALFNPAAWGLNKRGELQFYWNDLKAALLQDKNWALLASGGNFGFAVQHWDYFDRSGGSAEKRSLNDYNIGLGFGDRAIRGGVSYGWAKGDISPDNPRENLLGVGVIMRPNRYASVGLAGQWSLKGNDAGYLMDIGIRPLGSPMLTLFSDATLQSNQSFKDVNWSAGAAVQPVAGVTLFAKGYHSRIFNGKTFLFGASFSFGNARVSGLSRSADNSSGDFTTYAVRVGAPEPSAIADLIHRDKRFVRFDFTDRLRYQRYQLFDEGGWTLMELIESLQAVKVDPKVQGVVLKITEDMSGSLELVWEAREKIKELQSSGKKVVAFLERGGTGHYYLASVADRVMVDPETFIPMFGFNLGRTYYKRMLEKIGVGFDEWRFFKFKSALEGFARTDMSEGDREQLQALADGWYETLRADICADRGIDEAEFDRIINDVGLLNADSLMSLNLVDTVGRWDDVKDLIKSVAGEKRVMVSARHFNVQRPDAADWGEPPQIAVIYALGPCSMNDGINARRLEKIISRARKNDKIKAVVFRADSPGGDILPSDIVAQELKKTREKKPVIVTQGMVAASGGYWISMFGDTIIAAPWTITGSIGVIGGWFYNNGLGDKLGLDYDNVQRGDHADLGGGFIIPFLGGIPERNLTADERGRMEKWIVGAYDDFITKVADGREMPKDSVHAVAQGRVWTGIDGKRLGLVDELGGMETALEFARKAAGIKEDREVKVVEMPEPGLINPEMLRPKLLGIRWPVKWRERYDRNGEYIKILFEAHGRPVAMVPPDAYPETW